ncbi:MAG TPA: type II toxin-antitoxin system VapC family toxin [Pirellulales bacterium]|nr:type II toxin-antitoxin system VapC family toxin [Pirellulales bacterium]
MKYVLDSSLAFKWIVPEALSDKAILLRGEFRQGLHEFLAPDVFPVEVGHALTRAERQGRVSTADGFALWTDAMLDCPQPFASTDLMPTAYLLSSALRLGVYDCLYIALSQRESCPVVTADQRLVTRFPTNTVSLDCL